MTLPRSLMRCAVLALVFALGCGHPRSNPRAGDAGVATDLGVGTDGAAAEDEGVIAADGSAADGASADGGSELEPVSVVACDAIETRPHRGAGECERWLFAERRNGHDRRRGAIHQSGRVHAHRHIHQSGNAGTHDGRHLQRNASCERHALPALQHGRQLSVLLRNPHINARQRSCK
jgi:hypothetical protein